MLGPRESHLNFLFAKNIWKISWRNLQDFKKEKKTGSHTKVWVPCRHILQNNCGILKERFVQNIFIFSYNAHCIKESENAELYQHLSLSNSSNKTEKRKNTQRWKRHSQNMMHPTNAWLSLVPWATKKNYLTLILEGTKVSKVWTICCRYRAKFCLF